MILISYKLYDMSHIISSGRGQGVFDEKHVRLNCRVIVKTGYMYGWFFTSQLKFSGQFVSDQIWEYDTKRSNRRNNPHWVIYYDSYYFAFLRYRCISKPFHARLKISRSISEKNLWNWITNFCFAKILR